MSEYGTSAAAVPPPGTPPGPISTADRSDWLRLLGGVLFAGGAVVLAERKGDDWSEWAIFVVLLIGTAVLYAAGYAASRGVGPLQGSESACYAFAILLVPVTLLVLVAAIDDTPDGRLNAFWILAVSAAVGAVTALRRGAWWQMLIAGIYAIGSWIALWSKILDNPSANTIRWLLIVFAVILLVAAGALMRERRPQAADLVTAAGISAVLAGALGIASLGGGLGGVSGLVSDSTPKPTQGWNIFLFVVSLALIAYGARSVTRGPGYVGAVGFATFIVLVGTNVVARLNGDDAHAVVGWPLVLLILGAAALLASFLLPRRGVGLAGTPAAPPPAPPPPQ